MVATVPPKMVSGMIRPLHNVMLYSTVVEGVPLIQAVNAQHCLQRLGVTAIADLRINGLNEGSILD